jgi:purine catabolism regulator
VLAALGRLESISRDQQRAVRASLLEEMLKPHSPRDRAAITARAASLGFDFGVPAHVVVICRRRDATSSGARDGLDAALDALAEALAERGVAELSNHRRTGVIALVQAPSSALREHVDSVIARRPVLVAGVGRPVSDVGAVRESYRDAMIAVQRLDVSAGRRVLDFEDFDLVTLLLSEAPRERIQPKVDEIMGALTPAVHEALAAYFAHDLDVMAAADAMHVHHNTLRYRLGRAEDALGRPLKDPGTIAAVYIALTAERVDAPVRDAG